MKSFGLVSGRHPLPVDAYVLDEVKDVTDVAAIRDAVRESLDAKLSADDTSIALYVTGLTVITLEVVNYCVDHKLGLTCYHFNRDTGDYFSQVVL